MASYPHEIPVLYCTNNKLTLFLVLQGKIPKKNQVLDREWDADTLPAVLTAVKGAAGSKDLFVLLDDNLSYVLQLSLSKEDAKKREKIQEVATKAVPETLDSLDWDYKVVDTKNKSGLSSVIVFAPVQRFWNVFKSAMEQNKLHVLSVEPISVAKLRHKDPVIGAAMKKDIHGKDEEVLNIEPTLHKKLHKNMWPSFFLTLIAVSLGVFMGLFVYKQYLNTQITQREVVTQIPTPVPSPPSIPSPSPLPRDFSVRVLNGNRRQTLVRQVAASLEQLGFSSVSAGVATKSGYQRTQIIASTSIPQFIVQSILDALLILRVTDVEILNTSLGNDITIIVGG
ncbi:MAG TPA: LytR C-terminal domain-containing protein [Patescibacteria group bacterium]|nr:LytR C-terminal domain-containing protein [Patescibacteria group bacterium]